MTNTRNPILRASLCAIFVTSLSATPKQIKATSNQDFETRCAPDVAQTAERIFANSSLQWKEYASVHEVPPLDLANSEKMFALRVSSSGRRYVRSIEHGEDSSTYQGYCYDQPGVLRSLHYEMRTAWGWGYEDDRTFSASGTVSHSTRFFDTASHKTIPRPRQANDVPDFLKPTIYGSFNALPFVTSMKKLRINAPQK
jgi:hypothetical protein